MQRLLLSNLVGLLIITSAIYTPRNINQAQECYECAAPGGEIQGYVVDAQGQPVSEAIVHASMDNLEKGLIPSTETDEKGFYSLVVRTGAYTVYSGKKSAGYPETLDPIYGEAIRYVKVQVKKDQVISGVTLKLGSPLGKLSGTISDASTNNPITDAHITLHSVDKPAYNFVTNVDENGHFQIVAPPTPFTIEVSAEGYEKWRYKGIGIGNQMNVLEISSGSSHNLLITLRPDRESR